MITKLLNPALLVQEPNLAIAEAPAERCPRCGSNRVDTYENTPAKGTQVATVTWLSACERCGHNWEPQL